MSSKRDGMPWKTGARALRVREDLDDIDQSIGLNIYLVVRAPRVKLKEKSVRHMCEYE